MADASTTAYDATPYPDLSYAHTHPDRLGMIATLLGLEPAPVERCRVLELGCAVGGNLLPMAYALPGSTFVGVDYSSPQIDEARARAAQLELANVEFLDADVAALPTDLGGFDYIVAHGLYSWVPAPVRDALFEVCHRHLAPNGVAFVSYNTYPGWHALQSMRELMRYRTRSIEDPHERAAEARAAVGALAEALRQDDSAYAAFVQGYAENVLPKMRDEPESADALLLHDELEEVNEPVYFHEFVEHASRFGLRYLCEAQIANVMPERLPPGAAEHVQRLARDPIEFEQYMDFAKNRSFRETLICHANAEVGRSIDAAAVQRMHISSRARPSREPAADGVAAFEGLDGAVFRTNHPLTRAAFAELHRRSPAAVPFAELTDEAAKSVNLGPGDDLAGHVAELAANMLRAHAYSDSLIGLHIHQPRFSIEAGERPLASLVARLQAESGARVTNLRHERVTLDTPERELLHLLDGTRDRAALLQAMRTQPRSGEDRARTIEGSLMFLGRAALLHEPVEDR